MYYSYKLLYDLNSILVDIISHIPLNNKKIIYDVTSKTPSYRQLEVDNNM